MAISDIKANVAQRRALEIYLSNGQDKVDAYVRSRTKALAVNVSKNTLKSRAQSLFSSKVMKSLMVEADFQTRLQMERKSIAQVETAIEKYGLTKEKILGELAKIAFASQTDVMSWGPDGVVVKDSSEIGDAAAAISDVVQTGGGESPIVMRVKLLDKKSALEALGRELYGMFTQKVEHKGQVQMAVGAKFIIEGK